MAVMKIINARLKAVFIEGFAVQGGEAWCIVGSNRSGMDDFFRLVCGQDTAVTADLLELPENMGVVSFETQQDIYESELRNDDTDFMDALDPGTLAREFLGDVQLHMDLIEALDMTACLDRGYRQLSTGQSRKLGLLSQITKGVSCLAVQAPYDGLDLQSRAELDKALFQVHRQGVLVILFVHNRQDIPSWCTHAGVMAAGRLVCQGQREQVTGFLENEFCTGGADFKACVRDLPGSLGSDSTVAKTELVCLKNGSAGYGGQKIFQDLDLTVYTGDHTLVTGPNGSGKSTLLQVITGDHPACYQNDLRLFGVLRGSGESVWDLKKHMGIVSSDLHRNYVVPGNTLSCILSGLFDSIGLYRSYTRHQELQALAWLDRIGLIEEVKTPFRDLSYANQRLVLVARALIKLPKLLILDEPTQGMDELNRKAILDFLEAVAEEQISTILYVSHRKDEFRNFFSQQVRMG